VQLESVVKVLLIISGLNSFSSNILSIKHALHYQSITERQCDWAFFVRSLEGGEKQLQCIPKIPGGLVSSLCELCLDLHLQYHLKASP
jgi:hypothetical protein